MQEIDINNLIEDTVKDHFPEDYLIKDVPDNCKIVGEIEYLVIRNDHINLDLSDLKCDIIEYRFVDKPELIINHKLPNKLDLLSLTNLELEKLPKLPTKIKRLYIDGNKLTKLNNLPNSLKELFCDNNQLTELDDLPDSLEILRCGYNKITKLDNLPISLKELDCYNNQLSNLDNLPTSLKNLNCYNNQLSNLDNLPISLKNLNCSNNQLLNLYNLSSSLRYLDCSCNQITNLDNLPKSLDTLESRKNNIKYFNYTEFNDCLRIGIAQDKPLEYFDYYPKIKASWCLNFIVDGYNENKPITNQNELDEYMKYKLYLINMKKSARK